MSWLLGLTGSIGMGKSAVAAMFHGLDVPVFDADAEVRAMQGPGGELLPAIEAAFPGSTGPGGVDRDRLGHQVFADKAALARLEAIVHPAVAARRAAFLAATTQVGHYIHATGFNPGQDACRKTRGEWQAEAAVAIEDGRSWLVGCCAR